MAGEKEIQRKVIDLSPSSSVRVDMNKSSFDTVTVLLETNEGDVLAIFQTPLPLPSVDPIQPASYVNREDVTLSVEENFLKAEKFDRALDRIKARKYYNAALRSDSLHLASLRNLAILDFESGKYEVAASQLVKALKQIPNDDGLAWYFLGLCHLKEKNTDAAQACGFKASRCSGTVARGYDLVGRSYMLENKYDEAEKYFQKAYLSDLNDPLIYHHYLLAVYVSGKKEKALALASKRIEEYPTELTTRFLLAISERGNNSIAEIRDFLGEDDFQILETSLVFSRLGLVKEAIQILELGCVESSSADDQNHLIQYQLGYLNYLIGDHNKAAGYLKEASANYQDFNLVSRPEMEETLLYALRVNPEDAVASYQLGNLYANFGRLIEAEKYWEMATVFDPSMSIPWRNLGLYYWVVNNDHKKSESSYRSAINARPLDQTLYRDLAKVLVDNNKRKETIILLEKMKYKGVKRSDVIIDLAQYYLDDKRYDECIDLLSSVPYFVNWEGSSITWNIFNMANVKKGILLYEQGNYGSALEAFEKALTFPENLGVGQSHRTEEAMAWFWKGKTLLIMGDNEEAMIAWKAGASSINGSERQNRYIKLCSELYRNKRAI
jgi:tetratricopeptide (TPR) repeat protein